MAFEGAHRHLVLRNLDAALNPDAPANSETDGRDVLPPPDPGGMQLFSFYAPSLTAATYEIDITQTVTIPSGHHRDNKLPANVKPPPPGGGPEENPLPVDLSGNTTLKQTFEVIAPQFKIKAADIHSAYPPQGHADQPNVLPHIVLSDPHLPWERKIDGADAFPDEEAQHIPWLAVLPFDCNGPALELRLSDTQLNGLGAIYKSSFPTPAGVTPEPLKQSASFTLSMTVEDYLLLPASTTASTKVHIPPFILDTQQYREIQHDQTSIEVIFLSGALFKSLFGSTTNAKKTDLSPYRYVAHVRNVNTKGMTNAGVSATGLFSIVHSLRSGPTNIVQNTAPRSQVVHLLSLEHVSLMSDLDTLVDTDLVAMISLYSWTYLCQPPMLVNFVDSMRAIGEQIKDPAQTSLLRCSDATFAALAKSNSTSRWNVKDDAVAVIKSRMTERLSNGYTLVRHRVASGEETIAFTRGPLIPVAPHGPTAGWPYASNTGQDYQILDKSLGIMDISYSAAWQLGKTLAVADLGFVSALMRVRADAHKGGKSASDIVVTVLNVGFKKRVAVLNGLSESVSMVDQLTNHALPSPTANLRDRWSHSPPVDIKALSFRTASDVHPAVAAAFRDGVHSRLDIISSASTPAGDSQPFNEFNSPNSPDWAFVQSWIVDRLYLAGLPSHYLVTDPSYLPKESIRFFYIDTNWMDCLIDGALSVANHMADDDDILRDAIKQKMNTYFKTPIGAVGAQHYPQVPKYGFYLRSAVVTVFPDLVVSVPYADDPLQSDKKRSGRQPILYQKNVAKDILLVLLDRLPDDGELFKIKISQPPHQQRFSIGDSLTGESVEFLFRKVYPTEQLDPTTGVPALPKDNLHEISNPQTFHRHPALAVENAVYNWDTQCMIMSGFKTALFDHALRPAMGSSVWNESNSKLTSAMAGLQLNDTIKYLEIKGFTPSKTPAGPQPYSLRTQPPPNPPPNPPSTQPATGIGAAVQPLTHTVIHSGVGPSFSTPQKLTAPIPPRSVGKPPQSLSALPSHLNTLANGPATLPLRPLTPTSPVEGSTSLASVSSSHSTSASRSGPAPSPAAAERPPSHQGPSSPQIPAATATVSTMSRSAPPADVRTTASAANPFAAAVRTNIAPISNTEHDQQFTYALFPSTTAYASVPVDKMLNKLSFIYTDTPYDPDLIFSINLRAADRLIPNLYISEVQLKIPIGDPNLRKDPNPKAQSGSGEVIPGLGLTPPGADWAAVRGKMLNNQRWIVHLDPLPTYMVVRLVPRSMLMAYPVTANRNLSFKLDEVPLAGLTGKETQPGNVTIRVKEIYGRRQGDVAGGVWARMGFAMFDLVVARKLSPKAK